MNRLRAFTLVEMLAVIGIMLILMGITFGMFSAFAERAGPEAVMAIIQAFMNGARDYAASNGVATRIVFSADHLRPHEGTLMRLQYWSTAESSPAWQNVGNRLPHALRNEMYILRDMPNLGSVSPPSMPAAGVTPTAGQVETWRSYQQDMQDKVEQFAVGAQGKLDSQHLEFYLEFGPSGYPPADPNVPAKTVRTALTIVQLGGGRVVQYAFYPINVNTGTRLVFE